ncbi:HD-GYP domain-containing protein [Neobacillus mesonae]|nr:HD-GYP domain-containing protein [Neobacillus mesonae]
MQLYRALRKRLVLNYISGWAAVSILALLYILPSTLDLPAAESRNLAAVIITSLMLAFFLGLWLVHKQLRNCQELLSHDHSVPQLSRIYIYLHRLPVYALCRMLYPYYLCLSVPVLLLTTILTRFDLLHFSYIHIIYIVLSLFFVSCFHAIIEYFMTSRTVKPFILAVKNRAQDLGAEQPLEGNFSDSIRRKIGVSAIFLALFSFLLLYLMTEVRLSYISQSFDYEGWGGWLLLIGIAMFLFAVWLLIHDGLSRYSAELTYLVEGMDQLSHALKERDELAKQLQDSCFDTLAAALDARDPYTAGHSMRVAEYSVMIGRRMGLTKEELDILRKTALIHDIGKVGIPDMVLLKEGKLSEEEYITIQRHPVLGEHILQHVQPAQRIKPFLSGVRSHHERYDGKGYPDQLAGERIPLFGRIIAVADAFDAMTSDRPYRKGMKEEEAISILEQGRGTQWDPIIAGIFVEQYRRKPCCC